MTNSFFPPTGNEIIDSLRGLQLKANAIDNPEEKIDHVKRAVRFLEAGTLLGRLMVVDAASLFAHDPDNDPNTLTYVTKNIFFIAQLTDYRYMLDQNIPVDSLALGFASPEVIGVNTAQAEELHAMRFEVPILAIDSCSLAEAA